MDKHIKTVSGVRLKQVDAEGEGTGTAVIATLNVLDKDGDVTMPGAFGTQQTMVIPAHDWRSVPLGKAEIREEGDQVLADFKLNLETQAGRDWHAALKFDMANGAPLQEWSYGFFITDSGFGEFNGQRDVRFLRGVDVHEISPVMVGAGEGTRTVDVKHGNVEDKRAVRSHSTETRKDPWDGAANERRVRTGESADYYRDIYAWRDPDGDVGEKQSWKFIHHYVDAGGSPGAASVRAAVTGIGVLNGARGGTTIPDADRQGVHRHLARHLRDADENVPELRSYDECATKLSDQILFATWDAEAALERAKLVRAERKDQSGRDLSPQRITDLGDLKDALAELHRVASEIETALGKGDNPEGLESLLYEFRMLEAGITST